MRRGKGKLKSMDWYFILGEAPLFLVSEPNLKRLSINRMYYQQDDCVIRLQLGEGFFTKDRFPICSILTLFVIQIAVA